MPLSRKIGAMFALFATMSTLLVAPPASAIGGEFIWTKNYNNEAVKRPLDGSGSNVTATTTLGAGLALYIYGDYLYTCYGKVRRVGLDGTGATTLRTLADVYSVVSDGTYLYYGYENTQKIGRMNMDGTSPNDSWVSLSGIAGLYAGWMTINNGILYFGGGNNANAKKIGSVPTTGGSPTLVYSDNNGIGGITTDGTYLYWVHFTSGNLSRSLLDGSSSTENFVTGLSSNVWDVEYWNSYLYISNNTYIARVKSDGTGLQGSWILSGGDRGLAISGTPVVATTLVGFSIDNSPVKGISTTLSATFSSGGKVTFAANGKRIAKCIKLNTNTSAPFTATCNWKPAIQGSQRISASIVPTSTSNLPLTSALGSTRVIARKTIR
jgi:hypothetical protein